MACGGGAASPSKDWSLVFEALSSRISDQHWLKQEAWQRAKEDAPEGLACLVLDLDRSEEVFVASRALQATYGKCRDAAAGRSSLSFLQVEPTELDEALNGEAWRRLDALHSEVLQCSTAACGSEALAAQPKPVVCPVLSPKVGGEPCWQLLDAVPLLLPAESPPLKDEADSVPPADGSGTAVRHFVAYILVPLEAPVPAALWTGDSQLGMQSIADVASVVRGAVDSQREQGRTVAEVTQTAEQACKDLAGALEEAGEGDHFVPKLGYESVLAFERLRRWEVLAGCMETELRTAWEANDAVYRSFADGEAKTVACSVADPAGIDCPLIYISPGFEDLTGYRRTWALGRNCRFLQPNNRKRNLDLNGDELKRMRIFCTEDREGTIINLLYNEAANGRPFWNALFMQHVYLPEDGSAPSEPPLNRGPRRSRNARHYIFGVQTNITGAHKLALDQLVIRQECGLDALQHLRGNFRQKESSFSPSTQSLLRLCEETIADWIQCEGREIDTYWEGGHYVPKVGQRAIDEFAGRWPSLVEVAAASLRTIFGMRDQVLSGMRANSEESQVVCAVSDPSLPDCPLVFLSKAFERMTGYDCSFGLGRNCRFLQPNTADLNKTINGKELERMRAFCKLTNATGTAITNLLLNEQRGGERFWNLLHMTHVEVDGKAYIVGVQTILELPMPQLIKCRESSEATAAFDRNALDTFAARLGEFLDKLRNQLQDIDHAGAVQTIKQASIAILSFTKPFCNDFEGDHFVPIVGRKEAIDFEYDGVWSIILEQVQARWSRTLGVGKDLKDIICAVADPNVVDFPLVHVSRAFEEVTKYSRSFALGRSCRFLQPKNRSKNMLLNGEECKSVGEFCATGKHGESLMSLMVNEDADGEPFWNLLILEHITAVGRPYIIGVQTQVTSQIGQLAELLAMDTDSLQQLKKLQQIVHGFRHTLADMSIHDIASACVSQWAAQAPAFFQLPSFGPVCAATTSAMPCVSLQLTPKTDMSPVFTSSLENGIRHFHLAFTEEDLIGDKRIVGLCGKLFALRLAELLMAVRRRHLHSFRASVAFTLVTPPALLDSFASISRNLVVCRATLDCWMLDIREASPAQVSECWQTMLRALHAKETPALGLWGVSRAHFDTVSALPQLDKLSVVAVETNAVGDVERSGQRVVEFLRGLRSIRQPLTLQAYNVYGTRQSLLRSPAVVDAAKEQGTSASMLALKWSEAQGFVAVVPALGLEGLPEGATSAQPQLRRRATVQEIGSIEEQKPADPAAKQEVRVMTDLTSTDLSAEAPTEQDKDQQPEAAALNMHRGFVRRYHQAPPASRCAAALECALNRSSRNECPQSPKFSSRSECPQSPKFRRASTSSFSPTSSGLANTSEGGASDRARRCFSPGESTTQMSGKADCMAVAPGQELIPTPPSKPSRLWQAREQSAGSRPARRPLVAPSLTPKRQGALMDRSATIDFVAPAPRPRPSVRQSAGLSGASATVELPAPAPRPRPTVLQNVGGGGGSPRAPSDGNDGRRASSNAACVRLLPLEEEGKPDRSQRLPSLQSACSKASGAAESTAASEAQPSSADASRSKAIGKLRAKGWSAEDLAELFEMPLADVHRLLSKSSGCPSADTAVEDVLASDPGQHGARLGKAC